MSTTKLGRKKEHRERTLRNLATSLVLYEKVQTTQAKAKTVLPLVERLVKRATEGTIDARRYAKSVLFDENAVRKLFEDLPARQGTRASGFVRLTKLAPRAGDNAPMAQMELLFTPLEQLLEEKGTAKVKVRKKNEPTETTSEPEETV